MLISFILDLIFQVFRYFLWDRGRAQEEKEYREELREEAREKMLNDFQDYKEEFRLLRGHVEVVKTRNRQRKYEFELHIKTEDGTYPFEKIYGSLSKYDRKNKELRWAIEDYVPEKGEDEVYFVSTIQENLNVLVEDRRNLEDLKSEIRPFVEQPL